MKTLTPDICIIGSGPGGATAYYKLATTTDKDILLCEAGPDISHIKDRRGYAKTKEKPWRRRWGWLSRFSPSVYGNVGGASKFYAAALFRFGPEDFAAQAHGDQSSPAWPFTYDEIEPFYCEAEALFNVHGNEGDDPRNLPRSKPYPAPGVTSERPVAAVAEEMAKLGWDPFTTPVGIREFHEDRTAVTADAQNSCLECVTRQRAAIRANTRITRLIQGPDNRIVAALATSNGEDIRIEADQFVLACGTTHSALLVQDSELQMKGRSDLVGANYMFHQHTLVPVIDDDLAPIKYAKTLAFNRYTAKISDDPDQPFGHVQIMGSMTPELIQAYAGGWARWALPRSWLRPLTSNMILFLVSTEDLPLASNRISRAPNGDVQVEYRPTLREQHHALVKKFCHDLKEATSKIPDLDKLTFPVHQTWTLGLPPLNWLKHISIFKNFRFASNAHQCGTMKMGDDPKTSVVAPDGHVWGIDNLYVTDASVFPSSAHFNPTLTIVANSLRVAKGMAA